MIINIKKSLDSKLMITKHNKKKSAFTLIELIVVIAIIAILAAALTPSFTGYIKESRKVAVINQAKNVVTAYESVNAKTTNNISKDQSVSDFISSYGGDLIVAEDLKNIDIDTITVNDCFKAIDSDKYTFKLSNENMLVDSPTELPSTTTTPTE